MRRDNLYSMLCSVLILLLVVASSNGAPETENATQASTRTSGNAAGLASWYWFYDDPPIHDRAHLATAIDAARKSKSADGLFFLSELTSSRGVPALKDDQLSKTLLEEADALGHNAARATLGLKLLFAQAPFDEANGLERGAALLKRAAETRDPVALLYAGVARINDLHGFPRNLDAARSAFEESLLLGNLRAHYFLALVLNEQGEQAAARRHLEIGARAGDPQAKNGLALVLWKAGAKESSSRALELARDATQYGTPQFQYDYATMLVEKARGAGERVPDEVDELLERAADAGSLDALYLRGALHANRMLQHSDPELGRQLIHQAAAAGHPSAREGVRATD